MSQSELEVVFKTRTPASINTILLRDTKELYLLKKKKQTRTCLLLSICSTTKQHTYRQHTLWNKKIDYKHI